MTHEEAHAVSVAVESLTATAAAAEYRAMVAERQRDELRALLTRLRTCLAESTTLLEGDE